MPHLLNSCLSVEEFIFNTLLITFKVHRALAPGYICDLVTLHEARHSRYSQDRILLTVSYSRLVVFSVVLS